MGVAATLPELSEWTLLLQCYFEIANLLLACYLLKFSVFISCLMTKAINYFTSGIRKIKKNKRKAFCFEGLWTLQPAE